jgi:hypothetical protein
MHSIEYLIFPIYFIGLLFFALIYYRKKVKGSKLSTFFFPGLIFKVFCGIGLGFLFQFYYGGGDTFGYFKGAQVILDSFNNDIIDGCKMLFLGEKIPKYEFLDDVVAQSRDSFMMYRITAVISFLSFGYYSVTSIFISAFSFFGSWRLCNVLMKINPHLTKFSAIVFLFFPSVVFWGSGILVDALTVGFTGLLFSAFINFSILKKRKLKHLLTILICSYFIYILKEYILFAFLAMVFAYLIFNTISKFNTLAMKALVLSAILFIVTSGFVFFYSVISEKITEIMLNAVLAEAIELQKNIRNFSDASATYELIDNYENINLGTIISIAPKAIFTSIFRPFLWESHKVIQLVSGIENLFILIISIFVLIKTGFSKIWKSIFNNRLIFCMLIYVLIFAFAVGLAAGNFGALSRYRIPFMPYYFYIIGFLFFSSRKSKSNI